MGQQVHRYSTNPARCLASRRRDRRLVAWSAAVVCCALAAGSAFLGAGRSRSPIPSAIERSGSTAFANDDLPRPASGLAYAEPAARGAGLSALLAGAGAAVAVAVSRRGSRSLITARKQAVREVAKLTKEAALKLEQSLKNKTAEADGKEEEDSVPEWLPRVALFSMALCCSTNFTILKILEESHSESTVQAARFLVALVPFLPLIPKYTSWQSVVSGVEIGLWCFFGYACQAVGLPLTDASHGAFICSLAMVVPPIVELFSGEKVRMQTWIAIVTAVFGTGLLMGVGTDVGLRMGDIICGGTTLGFGLMFVRMDHHSRQDGFCAMGCTLWQVLTLAVCMTMWLLASNGPAQAALDLTALLSSSPDVLAMMAWVGIVTTAGVLYIETWAMERMSGSEAGIIFASEPVWASGFSMLVLGEHFGLTEGAGAFLILAGILVTQVDFDFGSEEKQLEKGSAV
eukprot:CAMPEP_0170597634 /NCGR_PEP_ID=MMETSP0224-20130122/15811_1 /TAXON_ID=285029 /ORGANISM="Togula jolla, Strain CCCM 725" /LENGTH=457 /DNA_ID=CAMNT_0010922117 /DNA_START=74 /DNA_END=1447 /DNA_ORIENTATION=+